MLRHISTYFTSSEFDELWRAANVEFSTTQPEASKRQKKADAENSVTQPEEADESIVEEIN